jgi:hypothetical protein
MELGAGLKVTRRTMATKVRETYGNYVEKSPDGGFEIWSGLGFKTTKLLI